MTHQAIILLSLSGFHNKSRYWLFIPYSINKMKFLALLLAFSVYHLDANACLWQIKPYVNGEPVQVEYNAGIAEINVEWGDLVVLAIEVSGTGTCMNIQPIADDLPIYRGIEDYCNNNSLNEVLSYGSFGSTTSNGEFGYCTLGSGERRIRINRLTTGIKQDISTRLNIFPTPSNSFIRIEKSDWNESFDYQLLDMNSRELNSGTIEENTTMDVSIYPAGQYLLQMTNDSGILRKRIVVL